MMDEANESLPFSSSSPSKSGDGGDDEPEGDRTASPVLRRPSTGYLGMGSCCEDGKLEGESALLGDGESEGSEARLIEVNGVVGDRSLEVELVDNEAKEVNLGREQGEGEYQGVPGVGGESRHLELEKAAIEVGLPMVASEVCEAKQEAETVGGSMDINGGVDIGNTELVSRVQEAEIECPGVLGIEEENGHLRLEPAAEAGVSEKDSEGCVVESHPASGMVVMSPDVNGIIDNGPLSDYENVHGKLVTAVDEAEEECQGFLGGKEENAHLGLEQPVEVGISEEEFDCCQLQPAFANGDVADQSLAVEVTDNGRPVDSGDGLGDLILGKKDDADECPGYVGAEETSKHLGLAQKLVVEASISEVDCFRSSAYEKVGLSKGIDDDVSLQTSEVDTKVNVVSVCNEGGSGESANERKDAEEEPLGVFVSEEEIGCQSLKQASVTEEEHDEFPGLSPLRTLGGDDFCCSMFGIGLEVGFLSSGVFDSDRVRNGCEDAELLVSSRLAPDCPLVKINRAGSKTADKHRCPQDDSQDCEANCTDDRCEKLDSFKAEKVNFAQCSGYELFSNDGNGEGSEFDVRIDQSRPLQYVESQKEHCGDNITGPYSICPQEISGGGEVDRSVQGSPNEDACPSAAQGLALEKSARLSTSIENFSLKLSSSLAFQGNEVDAFIGMSACCSNVNSSCGEADNGGRSDSKSSPTIVLRRANPKRGASLRSNLADGKYNQLSKTRNNRRNSRKKVDISSDFLLGRIKISKKLKKKRTWPHRPARPSVWGPVENLIKIYEQNVKLANYYADKVDFENKWSNKGRSTVGSKKQPKSQKVRKFQKSSAKHSSTSDQPVFDFMVGLPTSDGQIDFGKFNKVEAEHELVEDKFVVVKSLKRDRQLGDKDMESSLTQEVSAELGECPGVSSQIAPEMVVETLSDRNSLDPGTSPDSDVYHPVNDVGVMTSEGNNSADQAIGSKDVGIMTSEGATSRNQFSGTCQNVLVPGAVSEDSLHSAVSTSSKACVTRLPVSPLDPNLCSKAEKEKMNGQVRERPSKNLSITEKLHRLENLNVTKKPSKSSKSKQKQRDASSKNRACSKSIKKTTRKGSKYKVPPESSVPEAAELERLEDSMEVQNRLDKWVLPGQDVSNSQSEALLLHSDKTKGHKLPSGTRPGRSNGRSHCRETTGRRRQNARGKMEKSLQKSDNRSSTEERRQTLSDSIVVCDHVSFSSGIVSPAATMSTQQNCKANVGSRAIPQDVSSSVVTPLGEQLAPSEPKSSLEQPLPPQVAWVLCDDCEKWRCISVELANTLEETKCKWTCKDNTDKAFADCSIPQEKTNVEINAELGILDEEDLSGVKPSANGVEPPKLADVAVSQRASWTAIKSNIFLHRNRKNQTIDEIMVCHCKPPRDGHRGCGDQCLNRMLNIECVKRTCPCGDLCSNQRFQKRKYAKFKWFRCGKKGYGLQLQEDVSRGQFLIEYVGEVLDLVTYEARQRDYASRGQKHFYFMTLNGGEVIDAREKGNLGRFINHSCEPNCRTEKWMVNGEVCIGLFAIRDIKKDEEVTFDYNYVRVVGAAAKKCVCGSSECRGYIGGDPLNSEIIVQGDSDEEDIEPVMIREQSKKEINLNGAVSNTNDAKVAKHKEISVERKDVVVTCPPSVPEPEVGVQLEDDVSRSIPEVNQLDISLQSLDPMQSANITSRPISGVQPLGYSQQSLNGVQVKEHVCKLVSDGQPQELSIQASSTMNEVPSDSVLNSKKSITSLSEGKPNTVKPHSLTKSSCSRGTIKRGRSSVKNLVSHKSKTLTPGSAHGQFDGVEEKLNELLDVDGGISKQKDATRGYLKLLFVTAAEGDVGGCRSQSTRHLSLILDAILKTNSKKVLVDVINKNGLQMLHNIMKQNRGNFNRTPIIRKLLKVFKFLALTRILTPELINKAPPCTGMESFKESVLKLTNHNDKEVHKIAREFRDKWIPRNIRRVEPSDRDGGQLERQLFHRVQSSKLKYQRGQAARATDAIVISGADHLPASSNELATPGEISSHSQKVSISAPLNNNHSGSGTQTRKRKSRWDDPSDITLADPPSLWSSGDQILEAGPKFIKCTLAPSEQTAQFEVSKQTYGAERERNSSSGQVASSKDLMQLDERPPGFLNDEGPPGFLGDLMQLDERPPGFLNDEGPPGFEPLQKDLISQFSSETALVTGEVVMGHPQEIFLSHMTMSYGIPVALMQQLGTPETGGSQCNQNWAIAPGMPFYPFPPLPSYPRGQPNPWEERQQIHPVSGADLAHPSTSGGGPADMIETGTGSSQFNGRLRWPNNGCGRRFLRPQRRDIRRFQSCWPRWPRWPHQKFGRGFKGNVRSGPSNLEVGNGRGDFGGGLCPGVVNSHDGLYSNFHQPHN